MIRFTGTFIFLFLAQLPLKGQQSVKTHEGVPIGGIEQWIGATGDDDTKPLLLFLHGGPGFSSRAYSKKFVKHLRKDFIVAQWDQRGTGITKAWNPEEDSLSIDLMHADTREVVDYLLKKFDKDKLYLVGFSWGGFLRFEYASKHPDKLHAFISVSGTIAGEASDRKTLSYLLRRASSDGNATALVELQNVQIPFESWEQLYYQRKWTAYFSGVKASKRTYPRSLFEEWSGTWMSLFNEACRVDYRTAAHDLDCPIYFFVARKDLVANFEITQDYYESLKAERKHLIWFDESTHEIPTQEPKRFSEQLIKIAAEND